MVFFLVFFFPFSNNGRTTVVRVLPIWNPTHLQLLRQGQFLYRLLLLLRTSTEKRKKKKYKSLEKA